MVDQSNNGNQRRSVMDTLRGTEPLPPERQPRIPFSPPEPKHEPDDVEYNRLQSLADSLKRVPLIEIAITVKALTFGEMMEFVEGIRDADKDKIVPETISNDNLAHILHKWAVYKLKGDTNDGQRVKEGHQDQ